MHAVNLITDPAEATTCSTRAVLKRRRECLVKLPGPGDRLRCVSFCLSQWYHYLSIVRINPFRPMPSHSATESFRLTLKSSASTSLLGSPQTFFTRARTRSRWPCARVERSQQRNVYSSRFYCVERIKQQQVGSVNIA